MERVVASICVVLEWAASEVIDHAYAEGTRFTEIGEAQHIVGDEIGDILLVGEISDIGVKALRIPDTVPQDRRRGPRSGCRTGLWVWRRADLGQKAHPWTVRVQ